MYTLEIIASTPKDVIIAQENGADRIELVSGFSEGGLTPSLGLIEQVKKIAKIPVMVMIRPKGGNFVYSDEEIDIMERDIEVVKKVGLAGIVLGVLGTDNKVNVAALKRLLAKSTGLDVTFHRAFDECSDLDHTIQILISLNIKRILTSGRNENSFLGLETLNYLQEKYRQILFMPGVGLDAENLSGFLRNAPLSKEVHLGLGLRADKNPLNDVQGEEVFKARRVLDCLAKEWCSS